MLLTFPLSPELVRLLHGRRVSLFSGTSTQDTTGFGLYYRKPLKNNIFSKYPNRPLSKPYKQPNETGTERSILQPMHLMHLQNICYSVFGFFFGGGGLPKRNYKMQSVSTVRSSTGPEIIPLS